MTTTTVGPSKTEQRWLKCRLDKGMFSDEVVVTYPLEGSLQKSAFVPRSSVEGELGNIGRVLVKILGNAEEMIAVLPNSNQEVLLVVCPGDVTNE